MPNIGNNFNFQKNEVQNAVLHNLATAPSSPAEGQIYYDTVDKLVYVWDGTSWEPQGGGGIADGDYGDVTVSSSGAALTVDAVGGASAANIADAVTKRHTQNTDTGTTAASFQLESGSSGVRTKNSSGELQVRNAADNADANLKAADITATGNVVVTGNLTVNGTNTILNTTTMETGDNEIVLNSEITAAAGNTTGGIAIKRLDSDNSTRHDAKVQFNETSDRWEALFGAHTAAQITRTIALVYAVTIGDTSATQFTITHNLNSEDVVVAVRYAGGTKEMILTDWRVTGVNTVRVDFASAPDTDEFRVIVTG